MFQNESMPPLSKKKDRMRDYSLLLIYSQKTQNFGRK